MGNILLPNGSINAYLYLATNPSLHFMKNQRKPNGAANVADYLK
jgi:hypothetical protein